MKTLLGSLVIAGYVLMTGTTIFAVESTAVEGVEIAEDTQVAPAGDLEAIESIDAVDADAVDAAEVDAAMADIADMVDTAGLEPIELTGGDCVKCHYTVAADVDANGYAHKDLSCMECHEEHPPEGTNVIPICATCHAEDDNEHFAVPECGACHDPHHPLMIDFTASEEVGPACASCHQEQMDELAANPSAHTEQDCNSCHSQHGLEEGQYQTCLDCHEGHTPEMTLENCLECHQPHSPTSVTFGDAVPTELCAGCHEDVATSLTALPTMHSEMACVECHGGEHTNIIACVDCHEQPHDEYMHTQFPECLTCHRDPHNLAK